MLLSALQECPHCALGMGTILKADAAITWPQGDIGVCRDHVAAAQVMAVLVVPCGHTHRQL